MKAMYNHDMLVINGDVFTYSHNDKLAYLNLNLIRYRIVEDKIMKIACLIYVNHQTDHC